MKHMRLRVAMQGGFALPTILIASVIMLTILTSAVTAVSSMSTSIEAHYHNQLAREAAESGMARANDCLKQSPTGTPQWSDMKPLRPNTDCSGNILADKSQYITESGNVRTSFRVGNPSGSGDATRISVTGDIGLVRSSDTNTIWRAYTQTITQDARYQSQPKIAGGSGWLDAGHTTNIITTDGQLYGFGDNDTSQINDLSSPANVLFPSKYTLPSGVTTVADVKVAGQGALYLCILGNNGHVYCRGNGPAQVTSATWERFNLPAGLTATSFYADGYGENTMCVLASNGQGYCAGYNRFGVLGSGDTTSSWYSIANPQRFIIPAGRTLQKIVTSSHVTCGILNSTVAGVPGDDMYCSGINWSGNITGPSTTGTGYGFYATPIRYNIPGARKVKDVLIAYHSDDPTVHVLGSDGTIWSSGSYSKGDLGHSTTTGSTGTSQTPIPFTTSQKNYAAGSEIWNSNANKCVDNNAGGSANGNIIHIWDCAPSANHPNQTWYYGTEQQLTNFGTGKCLDVPNNASADGTLIQLYDCNGSAAQKFELVGGISGTTIRHISSGKCLDIPGAGTANGTRVAIHTCNGTVAQRLTRWAGIMGWQGMVTGTDHFCGLRTDLNSGMWCSGVNTHGQLMNWATSGGSFLGQCVSTPSGGYNYFNVNLPNGDKVDVSKLSSEWQQQFKSTMVIGVSGKVYGAGRDQYGKFGDGAVSATNDYQNCVTSELQLPSGVTAMDLSTRDEYTAYVLGSDGRVYAAGRNSNGQIGDGTTTDRLIPVEVKIPRQKTNY